MSQFPAGQPPVDPALYAQLVEERRKAHAELLERLDSNTAVAGGGPVERIINGKTIKFPELSFYDRRELLREWRKVERAERLANLREAAASSDRLYLEMTTFDEKTRRAGEGLWAEFFESDSGKLAILDRSLRKDPTLNEWSKDANALAAEVEKTLTSVASKWPEVSRLCALLTHTPIFVDTLKAPPPPVPQEAQTDPTPPPVSAQTPGGQKEAGTPEPKGFGTL